MPRSPSSPGTVLAFLLAIYTLSFVDRQIINILAEPIKQELRLADWQLGALTGLAFAILYTGLGVPIARLADRHDRVRIITIALVVWSLFTAVSAFARNFIELALARVGVGAGEAGCNPAAHSLITDIVPKAKRASALAFYALGIPIGSFAGLAIGGIIADQYGWRAALLVAGIPGIMLALVFVAIVRDPRSQTDAASDDRPTLRHAMTRLGGSRAYWLISFGSAAMALISYGQLGFMGSFFLRIHGTELAAIAADVSRVTGVTTGPMTIVGVGLASVIGVAGVFGTILGGRLADRGARADAAAYARVPAIAALISVPLYVVAFGAGSAVLAMGLLVLPKMLAAIWYGPVFAATQSLVAPRERATAAAVQMFITNLIGLGFGPLLVGMMSDFFAGPLGFGSAEGVRAALMATAGAALAAGLLFAAAAPALRREILT